MLDTPAPSFPIYVTLSVCGMTLLLVARQLWRLRDPYVTFLLLAIWLRYSVAAFHEYTYRPVALGLSAAALTSILVIAVGLIVVGAHNLRLRGLLPIYVVIVVILISGAVNDAWLGTANATLKWLYFVVFALATYLAMRRHGPNQVLSSLAVTFSGPIILQWLSVAWDLRVINEDRSVGFIGGYQHEQAFSIILLTFLFISFLSQEKRLAVVYRRVAIAAVGLVLANYRTSLLAAALPTASFVVSDLVRRVVPKQRSIGIMLLAAATVFVVVGIANVAQERFVDIGAAVDSGASLIQPPEHFTDNERRMFSGRFYWWSQYIAAYLRGGLIELLFGQGPESWIGRFPIYAHNTFISYLYELGFFGLVALTWVLSANLLSAAYVTSETRFVLLSCHIGFIVLNLGTMPIWTLEGDILYGLLVGKTWYLSSLKPRKLSLRSATDLPVRPGNGIASAIKLGRRPDT
jgi:hypothetical protein